MLRTALTAAALLSPSLASAAEPTAAQLEFFEKKIRPVLVESCYSCHSAEAEGKKKLKGGLLLDTKAGWEKGGDSGKAIVPGKPNEGTLLKSLKYADENLQMPPKGKLREVVIADFEKWIADGAADPRTSTGGATKPVGIDIERGKQFWSFQPPKEAAVPAVSVPQFTARTPIDAFVAAKWAEKGLRPAPQADKRTLIRRVHLDLVGLPPTPEDVDAFLADNSPEALAKVVDKLLATPAHGEKWARHWLDVARFAEDQAHTFGTKPKSAAWRYRDWVIAALNADMPFDRFVKLQLAGDLLPDAPDDPFTKLAGLGFLGLGAEYYKNTAAAQAIAEELDDRVDTVTRGFMGVTVSCARCHDHKFDPIPTKDYYSLAGIYMGTTLTEAPLASPAVAKAYSDAVAKAKDAENKVNAHLATMAKAAQTRAQGQTAAYLLAARKVRAGKGGKPTVDEVAKAEGVSPYFVNKWVKFLDTAAAKNLPEFKDWFSLKPDADMTEVKAAAEVMQKAVMQGGKNAPVLKVVVNDQSAPFFLPPADAEKFFLTDADKPKLTELRGELDRRKKETPPAPATAHVVSGNGAGMKVYVRGNPAVQGEPAPKGFLQVLPSPAPAGEKFNRLDLANAIGSKDNPLTARVIVNRVWSWHFGRGLVNTPSNFGKLGDAPSHPELLDWLAVNFVKNGWSLKWLHRQIVLSSVYQLSSNAEFGTRSAESETAVLGFVIPQSELRNPNSEDAANVYLWRGNRHRLDIEVWRDSLLFVSGTLDTATGGPTFDLRDQNAKRRTVYARISRHELDGLLRLFDFPDANVTADKRTVTTVPQQQLFALNSEFMANQARAFAARVDKLGKTDAEKVAAAYRILFGRAPETRETDLAERFLKLPAKPEDKLTRWQQYAQVLLASNELMYVD
jgi:mono/diheme cytochrome c family protein